MNMQILVVLLAAVPLAASAAGTVTTSPIQVQAHAPPTVKVSCDRADWPTQRQVARYIEARSADETEQTHQFVLREGRRACWQGATHVRVEFRAANRTVALAGIP
ncbi:hypothetical protein [Lysobacter fragariae]